MRNLFVIIIMCVVCHVQGSAQGTGLKTNVLYDLSLTPNASVEMGLWPHWTADIGYGLNPWTFSDNKKIRHWLLQPELRRYFCQRMNGSFVAVHLMGGQFNAGGVRLPFGLAPTLRHHRYEGWFVGAGVGWGYQWPLSRHFSMEAEVAVGYDYLKYDKYPCAHCGARQGDGDYHYVGPTKIALNLIYNINKGVNPPARGIASVGEAPVIGPAEAPAVVSAVQTDGTPVGVLGGRAAIAGCSLAGVGSRLVMQMAVVMDSLILRHGQTVVLRPVLRSADGAHQAAFRPLLVNSRDQHIMHLRGTHNAHYPGALELERRNGHAQTVNYMADVAMEEWMGTGAYTLEIDEDICGCGDPVADATTTLLEHAPQAEPRLPEAPWLDIRPDATVRKSRQLKGKAYLDFPVNKTVIYPEYRRNPQELAKIAETIEQVRQNRDVALDAVSIHGYASPEGSYQNNARLAAGRAAALRQYVKGLFHFDDRIVSETSTPEDWDGLRAWLAGSGTADEPGPGVASASADVIPAADREALLAIAGSDMAPDARDARMKERYPAHYAYILREVYPALRHSDYVVDYTIRPFSFEESKAIYRERPEDLSAYEIFRLAQDDGLTTPEGREKLYTAARLYPAEAKAQLVAAQAALEEGRLDSAAAYADKAGDSAQTAYVRGAIALRRGDAATARSEMVKARQGGITEAAAILEQLPE